MSKNFVELFNELIKLAKIEESKVPVSTSLDDKTEEIGLDSLDLVLIGMYLSELYGLDENLAQGMPITTLREALEFVEKYKTKDITSIKDAIEAVK